MSNKILSHLPKLPPIDAATQDLFAAIDNKDIDRTQKALNEGAQVNAVRPYFIASPPNDLGGGDTPLQALCTVYPQRTIDLSILVMLLERGADPSLKGERGESALDIISQRHPGNAKGAIDLLIQHGARPEIEHLRTVIEARSMWTEETQTLAFGETAVLDALWEHLSQNDRNKLDPTWMMKLVPNHSEALSYAQIKTVQWLANHCEDLTPRLQNKIDQRRSTTRPQPNEGASYKLH